MLRAHPANDTANKTVGNPNDIEEGAQLWKWCTQILEGLASSSSLETEGLGYIQVRRATIKNICEILRERRHEFMNGHMKVLKHIYGVMADMGVRGWRYNMPQVLSEKMIRSRLSMVFIKV